MTEQEPSGTSITPEVTRSRAAGRQRFSAQQAAHELETERTRHQLAEEARDNQHCRELERTAFWFIVVVLGVALIAVFGAAVWADNQDTRRWSQGILTLIVGALAGAAGGYVTGRRGK